VKYLGTRLRWSVVERTLHAALVIHVELAVAQWQVEERVATAKHGFTCVGRIAILAFLFLVVVEITQVFGAVAEPFEKSGRQSLRLRCRANGRGRSR
jgi:hypothetical protein